MPNIIYLVWSFIELNFSMKKSDVLFIQFTIFSIKTAKNLMFSLYTNLNRFIYFFFYIFYILIDSLNTILYLQIKLSHNKIFLIKSHPKEFESVLLKTKDYEYRVLVLDENTHGIWDLLPPRKFLVARKKIGCIFVVILM